MRIVEINGIKLEIDERTARTIEQYRVGDRLKVLVKQYGDSYIVCPGVIVGFSDFKALPTIEIMYLSGDRFDADVFKFVAINAATKDIEIAPFNELECRLDKQNVIDKFDRMIRQREAELEEMRVKREYFVSRFALAFENTVTPAAA